MENVGQDLFLQGENWHTRCHNDRLRDDKSARITQQYLFEVDRSEIFLSCHIICADEMEIMGSAKLVLVRQFEFFYGEICLWEANHLQVGYILVVHGDIFVLLQVWIGSKHLKTHLAVVLYIFLVIEPKNDKQIAKWFAVWSLRASCFSLSFVSAE